MSKLPVASKARNGPRWAESEAPVVHVPGSLDMAALAKPKAKTAAREVPIGAVEALPLDAEMVARVTAFIIEREKIANARRVASLGRGPMIRSYATAASATCIASTTMAPIAFA
jgi:hypothetical protein